MAQACAPGKTAQTILPRLLSQTCLILHLPALAQPTTRDSPHSGPTGNYLPTVNSSTTLADRYPGGTWALPRWVPRKQGRTSRPQSPLNTCDEAVTWQERAGQEMVTPHSSSIQSLGGCVETGDKTSDTDWTGWATPSLPTPQTFTHLWVQNLFLSTQHVLAQVLLIQKSYYSLSRSCVSATVLGAFRYF